MVLMSKTNLLFRDALVKTLAKYIGTDEASKELEKVYSVLGLENKSKLSTEDLERVMGAIENSLGKEVGGAMAYAVVTDRLEINPQDVGRFYESFYRMRKQLLERQRNEHKLNEELTRLKEMYENVSRSIPIGLCSIDMSQQITTWNRAMESLTDISFEDAISSPVSKIVSEYEPLIKQALERRDVIKESRFEKVSDDGEKRIESLTISPLVDRFDVLRGLVLAVQDVTELAELEENVMRAEKLASVGRLAAGVAHEVGNPLTSISALIQELADDDGQDEAFRKESLALVAHHIKRISDVLNSLVDFSRKKDISFSACSISQIINNAYPLVKLDKNNSKKNITLDVDDGLPLAYCDPAQIEQVMVNLLFNAADATEEKGSIKIRAYRSSRSTISISVKDDGMGMEKETIKQAFIPFFTTKPVGKGTGLGLYACFSILEHHNSRLNFSSVPGQGTIAEFELSVARPGKTDAESFEGH